MDLKGLKTRKQECWEVIKDPRKTKAAVQNQTRTRTRWWSYWLLYDSEWTLGSGSGPSKNQSCWNGGFHPGHMTGSEVMSVFTLLLPQEAAGLCKPGQMDLIVHLLQNPLVQPDLRIRRPVSTRQNYSLAPSLGGSPHLRKHAQRSTEVLVRFC